MRRSLPARKLSTMSRFRWRTRRMSISTAPDAHTVVAPRVERGSATRALATIVLVGVQPSLIHVPPTCSRSISAVFSPARASALRQRPTRLPGPDHDRVEVRHDVRLRCSSSSIVRGQSALRSLDRARSARSLPPV